MDQPQISPAGGSAPTPKKTSPLVWILGGCAIIIVVGGIIATGLMWWGYHKAKTYVKQTLEKESGDITKVSKLWDDVPPMQGMTQSSQADMPLPLKAITRTFLSTMMRGMNNGKDAGQWDVAFYTVDGKTTRDVESFYTSRQMANFGWKSEGGCANVSQATFCSFQKEHDAKTTGLLIIAADDQAHNSTVLYFIRQEAQAERSTTGSN